MITEIIRNSLLIGVHLFIYFIFVRHSTCIFKSESMQVGGIYKMKKRFEMLGHSRIYIFNFLMHKVYSCAQKRLVTDPTEYVDGLYWFQIRLNW